MLLLQLISNYGFTYIYLCYKLLLLLFFVQFSHASSNRRKRSSFFFFFLATIDPLFFTVDYLRKQYTWPASRSHTCTKLQRAEIATQCTSVHARVLEIPNSPTVAADTWYLRYACANLCKSRHQTLHLKVGYKYVYMYRYISTNTRYTYMYDSNKNCAKYILQYNSGEFFRQRGKRSHLSRSQGFD